MKRGCRGLATLTVVMALFLIALLATLHLGRSLVLEQGVVRNQLATAQAEEAAEAGLDWTLTLLAAGRIDDRCAPSDDPGHGTLRDRLLQFAADGTAEARDAAVRCAWQGERWACRCPATAEASAPTVAALPPPPAGAAGPFPAFRVAARAVEGAAPGVLRLRAVGCSTGGDACLAEGGSAPLLEARASRSQMVALAPALPRPPTAAVTVRGQVRADAATLRAVQADPASDGLALVAGQAVAGTRLHTVGPAGSLPETTRRAGVAAIPADRERFAAAFLAAWPEAWAGQPAVLSLDCTPRCDSDRLRAVAAAHPGRPLRLRGPVRLDGALGSPAAPLMVVADGPVELLDTELAGLLWLRGDTLDAQGAARVQGALIAEGDLVIAGGGSLTVQHDAAALERLRLGTGSWARVPGGWSAP